MAVKALSPGGPRRVAGSQLLVLLVLSSPPELGFFGDSHCRAELRHWSLWTSREWSSGRCTPILSPETGTARMLGEGGACRGGVRGEASGPHQPLDVTARAGTYQ